MYGVVKDNEFSKKLRFQLLDKWPKVQYFPIEKIYFERLNTLSIKEGFKPVKMQYSIDPVYNKAISNILDGLDFLPRRPDLAFDLFWRGFDYYSTIRISEKNIECNNEKERYFSIISNIFIPFLNYNKEFTEAFQRLFEIMPMQSCEYVFKKFFSEFDKEKSIEKQNKELNRIIQFDGGKIDNKKMANIFYIIGKKYSFYNNHLRRNGSRIIFLFMQGNSVSLEGYNYEFDLIDKIHLLINGLLYSFRNDRAHGLMFSPFRSSSASLRTYIHCHYCYLLVYYFLILLLIDRFPKLISLENFTSNIIENIEFFEQIYGRNTKR